MEAYKPPKYIIISREIINLIESKKIKPGCRIPSENEIIRDHKVSNTTARKVLQEIERGGYVTKIQGKGTIVKDFVVARTVSKVLSFTRNMREMGLTPSTRLIDSLVLDEDVRITVGDKKYLIKSPVFKISRLRFASDTPMMYEKRYISLNLCPDIESENLEKSLYEIYKDKYSLKISRIEQDLSAITIDEFSRQLFDLKQSIPGIKVEGITFCNHNKILEAEESIYRGDKYKFSVQAVP